LRKSVGLVRKPVAFVCKPFAFATKSVIVLESQLLWPERWLYWPESWSYWKKIFCIGKKESQLHLTRKPVALEECWLPGSEFDAFVGKRVVFGKRASCFSKKFALYGRQSH
jgi:hypothetical protein